MTRPVLLVAHRYPLVNTFKNLFHLDEPQHVWNDQGVTVEEYHWKSIQRLCIVRGARNVRPRDTIATIQQVASSFDNPRIIFVCHDAVKRSMINESHVVFPNEWSVCVNVDEFELSLGEDLTSEQKRIIEQRHLPRSLPNVQRRRRRRGNIQQLIIRFNPYSGVSFGNSADFEEAIQRSLIDYQNNTSSENIRDQKRKEHPWDGVLQEVIPITNPDEDNICCVCAENYSTIQTVDIAAKCDHIVMCDACARIIMDTTKKCPICRADAVTIRRTDIHLPSPNRTKRPKTEIK